jgi:energy-coupling factor transporter ATP-binding protein EcfA2
VAIDDGHLLVHAGAVGRQGRAVLLLGPGGAGKSTFVRCAVGAGAAFLGDNAIEVAIDDSQVTAWGAYGSLKVRLPLVLPEASAGQLVAHDEEISKDLYDLRPQAALGLAHEAVALVAVSPHSPVPPEPLGRGAALFAVAPSTMVQFPLYGPEVFDACGELVRAVDCYSLGRLNTVAEHGEVLTDLLGP